MNINYKLAIIENKGIGIISNNLAYFSKGYAPLFDVKYLEISNDIFKNLTNVNEILKCTLKSLTINGDILTFSIEFNKNDINFDCSINELIKLDEDKKNLVGSIFKDNYKESVANYKKCEKAHYEVSKICKFLPIFNNREYELYSDDNPYFAFAIISLEKYLSKNKDYELIEKLVMLSLKLNLQPYSLALRVVLCYSYNLSEFLVGGLNSFKFKSSLVIDFINKSLVARKFNGIYFPNEFYKYFFDDAAHYGKFTATILLKSKVDIETFLNYFYAAFANDDNYHNFYNALLRHLNLKSRQSILASYTIEEVKELEIDKLIYEALSDEVKSEVFKNLDVDFYGLMDLLKKGLVPKNVDYHKKLNSLSASVALQLNCNELKLIDDYFKDVFCSNKPLHSEILTPSVFDKCLKLTKEEEKILKNSLAMYMSKYYNKYYFCYLGIKVCDIIFEENNITIDFYYKHPEPLSFFNTMMSLMIEKKVHCSQYVNTLKNDIIKKLEELYKDDAEEAFVELIEEVMPSNLLVQESSKVNIGLDFKKIDNYYIARFSIIDKKEYRIDNLKIFFDNFINKNKVSYDKSFTFEHKYQNLKEPYGLVMKYFTSNFYAPETHYLKLSETQMINIIELLKEVKIKFSTREFQLVKKENLQYRLNNKYFLETKTRYEDILISNEAFYGFNYHNSNIEKYEIEPNVYPFLIFARKLEGICIKNKMDKFMQDVYPRFKEYIELPKEFESKDLTVIDNKVNVYFDADKTSIYASLTINKGTYEAKEEELDTHKDASLIFKLKSFKNYLMTLGFDELLVLDDEKAVLNFYKMDFTALREIANVFISEKILNRQVVKIIMPTIQVRVESNMMEAIVSESSYTDRELSLILRSLRLKKKFVLLNNNTLVDLTGEEASELEEISNDLNINEENPLEKVRLPFYEVMKAYAHKSAISFPNYLEKMIDDLLGYEKLPLPNLNIHATLRKYQESGVKWLMTLAKYHLGGILADDMGLGKTLQIICLIEQDSLAKPSLIVSPKSLIYNWKNEINKFAPHLKVVEIYGNKRQKLVESIDNNSKVIYLTNYDSLINDISYYENKEFNYLILDEAQAIKNYFTKKAINVKKLNALNKFALSGTPIENSPLDLWSLFDFIMPGYLGTIDEFRFRVNSNSKYLLKLKDKVLPFILRRVKKDVLDDLPNKYERYLTCQMESEQRAIYDAEIYRTRVALANSSNNSLEILKQFTRLRQICVDPRTYIENINFVSCKMKLLEEIIDERIDEHKIVIFSQFTKALDLVREMLDNKDIASYTLTGETLAHNRLSLAEKFNASTDVKIFLVSLKAGGSGLNLTGADVVIHLDPWWNIASMDQATDRVYRIGQNKNVEVCKLICENSIEERVVELQETKRDIIDSLISDNPTDLSKISKDDFAFILKDF